jgi:hypothetical protein
MSRACPTAGYTQHARRLGISSLIQPGDYAGAFVSGGVWVSLGLPPMTFFLGLSISL